MVSVKFAHQNRTEEALQAQDRFGANETLIAADRFNAGRPKLPIRLMVSPLLFKLQIAHTRSHKAKDKQPKLYNWHAPEVECISKGKSRRPMNSA